MIKKTRLDNLLFERKIAVSRSQAAGLIMAGRVTVDARLQTKPGAQVRADAVVSLKPGPKYVSRAALKLESVAAKLRLNFKGKVVLDVGSSTGGFTDFCLQQGAIKMFAVDVGTNQLAYKLRQDARVVVMEKTDIRSVTSLPEPADMAVADVSFISLRKVLPGVIPLLKASGQIIAMVKPQFEADKTTADKHKGVIKNNSIRRAILKDFEAWAKDYFVIKAKADSEISGAKGNIERFYLLVPLKAARQ